jgi:hypothetical protein
MEKSAKILARIFEKENKEIMCSNANAGKTLINMTRHLIINN